MLVCLDVFTPIWCFNMLFWTQFDRIMLGIGSAITIHEYEILCIFLALGVLESVCRAETAL